MQKYIVLCKHPVRGSGYAFAVYADDEDHAKEQVLERLPTAKNLTVSMGTPEDKVRGGVWTLKNPY